MGSPLLTLLYMGSPRFLHMKLPSRTDYSEASGSVGFFFTTGLKVFVCKSHRRSLRLAILGHVWLMMKASATGTFLNFFVAQDLDLWAFIVDGLHQTRDVRLTASLSSQSAVDVIRLAVRSVLEFFRQPAFDTLVGALEATLKKINEHSTTLELQLASKDEEIAAKC